MECVACSMSLPQRKLPPRPTYDGLALRRATGSSDSTGYCKHSKKPGLIPLCLLALPSRLAPQVFHSIFYFFMLLLQHIYVAIAT
jgi:hypothetical protein